MQNKLIILEGPDGAGKTMLAKDLKDEILNRNKNLKVKVISFPHSQSFGYKKLREVLTDTDRYPTDIVQSIFIANQIECAENVINPFFEGSNEDRIVILDRSLISTVIYNALNGGTIFHSIMEHSYNVANQLVPGCISYKEVDFDIISKIYTHIIKSIDYTFFILPPKEILLKHANDRASEEENDSANSVIKSYEAYLTLYKFLTGSLKRDIVDLLEYSVDMLVPNPKKYDTYVKLDKWDKNKSEVQNYASYREEVLAKLNI